MAKITWTFKNEEGTNLNRYIATNVSTGEKITFDLLRGGNISVVGTPLNAENLNALITSINACYDLISSSEKDTTYTLSKNGNAIRLTSSDGTTNDVTLNKSDVGLSNVDNTSDKDKPVSTAQQKALDTKADKTATQQELDLKANKSDVYTKTETENKLNTKANASDVYTKSETYSKNETDTRIAEKLDEKQTTDVNCSHEVEITGFGEEDCNLAIDDQDVVITKIQGQTRRKSLNLCKLNSDITIIAGTEKWYFINTDTLKSWGLVVGNTYTIIAYDTTNIEILYQLMPNYNGFKNNAFTFTFSESTALRIGGNTITSETTVTPKIMLVEGTYTTETMPPYEPYDNTLVNSKCDFVSTGRNLLDLSNKTSVSNDFNIVNGGIQNSSNKFVSISFNVNPNTDYYLSSINESYSVISSDNLGSNVIRVNNGSFNSGNNTTLYYCTWGSNYQIMLNYGDTALPYEPYVEDTMQCGLELGAFDYHDNINHITHRQTSEMITLNGSENWQVAETITSGKKRFYILANNAYGGTNSLNVVSNWIDGTAHDTNLCKNCISCDGYGIIIYVDGITTVEDFKSWLRANPITLVYKLATETTEENILPSGYKVWYKGMQVQKTNTIPYILTKQYAISLASQVLNNVSIDRSQQKQIDELKTISENKVNAVYFEIERQISNVDNFITYLNNSNINIGDYVGKIMIFRTSIGDDEFDYIIIPSYYDYNGFLVCEDNIYHLYFNGDTYAVGKYLLENEINNKFGGFKFTKKGSSNVMYAGEDSTFTLISNYDEETQTEGTVVGNIDRETLIRGIAQRPSYTNGFTTSHIALSTDLDAITKRLDDLGFKQGVVYYDGTAVDSTLATIKKQGKIAILNAIAPALGVSTISVPAEFKPKEETTIMCMSSSTYGAPVANTISIKTDGTITTPSNFVKIVNAAWVIA